MVRIAPFVLALLCAFLSAPPAFANPQSLIVSETAAARHGLTRAWFSQMQIDRSRARLRYLVLHEGTLYAQSDRATVHALGAETGETLWTRQIGRPEHPSLVLGAGGDLLAVVNGSRVYVVNRHNGNLLLEQELPGAPGAGPALSQRRVYVPMISGRILAYRIETLADPEAGAGAGAGQASAELTDQQRTQVRAEQRETIKLDQETAQPLALHAYGRMTVQPLVTTQSDTEEFVTWPTERGFLYTGSIDARDPKGLIPRYRLPTEGPIVSRAAFLPPDPQVPGSAGTIFTASHDGYVYAVEEKTGVALWSFSCGEAIVERPALIFPRLFVTTQLGGMFSLDVATGAQQWWAPNVRQFVAASNGRVYAFDTKDQLLVLDIESGARLDSIDVGPLPVRLANDQTDRIYLASATGLIHCLHERELPEPLHHNRVAPEPQPTRPEVIQEALPDQPPMDAAPPRPEPQPAADPSAAADPFGAAPQPAAENQDDQEADAFGVDPFR